MFFGSFRPAFCQPGPPPFPITPLNFWYLDQPNWPDWWGDAPLGFANLNTATGWASDAGTALSVDTNYPAFLNYCVADAYGDTNISLAAGTISFWFQPNFTSTIDLGDGPTNWACLLSVGQWTSNASSSCWSLAIDPDGTNLVFLAQSNGASQTVLAAPIDFDAGDWHNICLTYSPTNCCLYLEGQPVTNAGPIAYLPDTEYGFFVGSESTGVFQARGQFQNLETYDGPQSAADIARDYTETSAVILNSGGSIPADGGSYTDDLPGLPGGTNSDGGGTSSSDGGGITNYGYTLPNYTITTNYANYTNFWLVITNYSDGVVVTIESTLSNLTYEILTNGNLATTNWGIWQILTASNSFTAAPPLAIGSNKLFFKPALIGTTGTNGLPDWWQMEYFGALNVDPYADPDNDGLCNLDEYQLGTNPTNAYSVTPLHNDAQVLFLAYTNYDSHCRYALIVAGGSDTNTMLVTMVNTVAGMNYQIYTCNTNDITSTWRVETNFVGSNTATTVPVYLGSRSLFYMGGSGEDSDGDGLPDGYEVLCTLTDPLLPDTGLTGTPDGYKDPDGDGYSNLQEMYNGTNPHVFNAPASPIVSVAPMPGGSGVLISWEPAPGDVNSYTVYQNGVAIKTLPADSTSYLDGGISVYPGSPMPAFQVVVQYVTPSGSTNYSSPSMAQTPENQNMAVRTAILRGPHGQYFLAAPNIPNAVTNLRMFAQPVYSEYPNIFFNIYSQPMTNFNSSATAACLDIPSAQFGNGLFPLPQSFLPYYNAYTLFCIPMGTNGAIGPTNFVSLGFFQLAPDNPNWFNSETASLETGLGGFWGNLLPFLDGTAQLQQNLIFQLESADEANALEFAVADEGDLRPTAIPMNEFSDNYFLPNYAWANFHVKYGEEQDTRPTLMSSSRSRIIISTATLSFNRPTT